MKTKTLVPLAFVLLGLISISCKNEEHEEREEAAIEKNKVAMQKVF